MPYILYFEEVRGYFALVYWVIFAATVVLLIIFLGMSYSRVTEFASRLSILLYAKEIFFFFSLFLLFSFLP